MTTIRSFKILLKKEDFWLADEKWPITDLFYANGIGAGYFIRTVEHIPILDVKSLNPVSEHYFPFFLEGTYRKLAFLNYVLNNITMNSNIQLFYLKF